MAMAILTGLTLFAAVLLIRILKKSLEDLE